MTAGQMFGFRASVTLVIVTSSACAAGQTTAQATWTKRDSAGIEIIESAAALWRDDDALTLADTPLLVIGAVQDKEETRFSRIAGALRLADGRIVVADGASRQLRFFDSTGQFLRTVGRSGDGPGEFHVLVDLRRLPGDTIVAGDWGQEQFLFSSSGEYMRPATAERPWSAVPRASGDVVGRFDSEHFITGLWDPSLPKAYPTGSQWAESLTISISTPDSTSSKVIGRVPLFVATTEERGRNTPWFGPRGVFANSAKQFFVAFGAEYSIRVFSSTGTLNRIIRKRWTAPSVTPADIDLLVAYHVKKWEGETRDRIKGWVDWLRNEPVAKTQPAMLQMIADDAGRLWVRNANLIDIIHSQRMPPMAEAPSTWSVFDSQGRWLTDVGMPKHFLPREIGREYVLGVAVDADSVEHVVLYRLSKGVNK